MTGDAASDGKPDKASEDKQPSEEAASGPRAYVKVLGDVSKWAVAALGAVATFAVANIGLSKLGSGATNNQSLFHWPGGLGWALLGLLVLTIGIIAIISSIVWLSRSSRISMAYLLSPLGRVTRSRIEYSMPYLLCGHATLQGFVDEYSVAANGPETARAEQMEAARFAILETASAERSQDLVSIVLIWLIVGGLLAAFGAGVLIANVNAASVQRQDQLAAATPLTTGDLLPRIPTEVVLAVPILKANDSSYDWVTELTDTCVWQTSETKPANKTSRLVSATLLDIGTPPPGAIGPGSQDATAIFRIATSASKECPNVVDGWVHPDWIALPPEKSEAGSPDEPPTSPTATPS